MTICGLDCCKACERLSDCGGCASCGGHPFGGNCVAAETVKAGGMEGFASLKNALIDEINALGIPHLHVEDLNLLNGFFVNLEYELPNGEKVKLLKDADVYLGNQIEIPNSDRCCGVVADDKSILVCEYGCMGAEPEIVVYKRR